VRLLFLFPLSLSSGPIAIEDPTKRKIKRKRKEKDPEYLGQPLVPPVFPR